RSRTRLQKPNNSATRRRRQWLSTVRRLVSPDFSALSAKLVSRKSSFSFRNSSCHNSRPDARIFCRAFTHRSRGRAKEMLAGASSVSCATEQSQPRRELPRYCLHSLLYRRVLEASWNRHRFVRRIFENESEAGAEHRSYSIARGHSVDSCGGGDNSKCVRRRFEQTGDCRSFQQLAND